MNEKLRPIIKKKKIIKRKEWEELFSSDEKISLIAIASCAKTDVGFLPIMGLEYLSTKLFSFLVF